jgi:hypothetical protein
MPRVNTERQMKVFGYGLPLLVLLMAWRHWHKSGTDGWVGFLIILAAALLFIAIFAKTWLKYIFNAWMTVAQAIGKVVTAIILTVVYWIIFTPIGFFMRCSGKDPLSLGKYRTQESYWIKRQEGIQDKERYKQQF